MMRVFPWLLAPLLVACGSEPAPEPRDDDPAMALALAGPLMTDPDLVALNRANAAALLPEEDGSIPVEDDSPELIAAARAEALALVGGPGRMERAPRPDAGEPLPAGAAATVVGVARAALSAPSECFERAGYTAAWAARMPDPFPVYPKAAVQEAAGSDDATCALRAVHFTTPVPVADVVDFYFTRARRAGYAPSHRAAGDDFMLEGRNGASRFALYARRANAMTAVDLVTLGE